VSTVESIFLTTCQIITSSKWTLIHGIHYSHAVVKVKAVPLHAKQAQWEEEVQICPYSTPALEWRLVNATLWPLYPAEKDPVLFSYLTPSSPV